MAYDFDLVCDRRGTDCSKYDAGRTLKGRDDLLPLWVADMDFKLPDEIVADLQVVVDRGIYGYGFASEAYFDAVQSWFAQRHHWNIESAWIAQTPGVVYAIGTALQAFTNPGDAVLIQQPVYYPFEHLIKANDRALVNSELLYSQGCYLIDFDDFEAKAARTEVKAFILSNPHNPVGRVWTPEELVHMGRICAAHDVVVIADEIHADFTYPGFTHHPFPTLDAAFAANCIVCTAPSKTFNLAGLQLANIVIPDETLRRRYRSVLDRVGYKECNILALEACRSAYTRGAPWLDELKHYLLGNLAFLRAFLQERLPRIRLVEPQGTYLAWLDCTDLGLDDAALERLIVDEAHLWLDAGTLFGTRCAQFERINLACPRSLLAQALEQLEAAVAAR